MIKINDLKIHDEDICIMIVDELKKLRQHHSHYTTDEAIYSLLAELIDRREEKKGRIDE